MFNKNKESKQFSENDHSSESQNNKPNIIRRRLGFLALGSAVVALGVGGAEIGGRLDEHEPDHIAQEKLEQSEAAYAKEQQAKQLQKIEEENHIELTVPTVSNQPEAPPGN